MASRNRTASWIHYPLPQPPSSPLGQGDQQQVLWLFRLSVDATVEVVPPPPPVVETQALTGGRLTAQQIARLRGWQAPPRRQTDADVPIVETRGSPPRPGGEGAARQAAGPYPPAAPPVVSVATLSATDTPDLAPLWALAALDLTRRQAQQRAAEEAAEAEALMLMLVLLEEI